jgi:hypothetical protein
LWLIEPGVFQMPQLHKHFSVSGNYIKNLFQSMRNVYSILLVCLFSCGTQNDEKIIDLANYRLKDSSTLVLQIKTDGYLGATTPDVTWINKKLPNGQEEQIGKIKRWLNPGIIKFEPLNDSLINIHFVDSVWHHASLYTVNINQRIYPNDGRIILNRNRAAANIAFAKAWLK